MEQSRLRKLRGDLDQLIESDPKLRALRPHLKIDLVREGLRIQIIDSQNRPMFRTGSADVGTLYARHSARHRACTERYSQPY